MNWLKKIVVAVLVAVGVGSASVASAAMTNATQIAEAVGPAVNDGLDKGVGIWLSIFTVVVAVALIRKFTSKGAGR